MVESVNMAPQKKSLIQALEDLIVNSENHPEKLKILIVGSEIAPYAYVGGIAMVLSSLASSLRELGHDVRLFMPKFGGIDEDKYDLRTVIEGLDIPTGNESTPILTCNVKYAENCANGVPTYFLENQEYYEKRANIYGYSDDPTRWALLSRGVLEFIRTEEFVPHIIHANDWLTALVPNYLRTCYKDDPLLKDISTIYTIHNIMFQGQFDHKNVPELDIDIGRSDIAPMFSDRLGKQNFMRRGILHADVVNTVSKKYAKEVLTEDYGEGLEKLLLELQGKFFGIMNGIDYESLDPKTDRLLVENFGLGTLSKRIENKRALQKEFDLEVNDNILLLGTVGRLDFQKGVDLIVNTLRHVLQDYTVQFVQVGGGDTHLAQMLNELKADFPDKVGVHPYPNFTLPRLLFGGCDAMLFPSRFEPCGVTQLEAMRYGAVPIVRGVGGLYDSVTNFDTNAMTGTGFVFKEFNEFALFGQIVRAIELYNHKNLWTRIQKNCMKSDFSWQNSAAEYVKLYELAMHFHEKGYTS